MAQIHALLLISPDSLSTDDIMNHLKISRGNANMNLRGLIDWGIIFKEHKPGHRKEYFVAEKDIWIASKQIMRERKKRELDPAVKMLNEVKNLDQADCKETEEFVKITKELADFANRYDALLEKFIRAEENLILRTLMKVIA
jgi:DNA-binding transcriptional regulator GbsR (MarR family)